MMKKFNYKRMISRWVKFDRYGKRISYGLPSEGLVQRAQEMASIIMCKIDFGIYMNDLPDLCWHDRLWNIENDEELFSRVQEIIIDLVDETSWPAKNRNEVIRAVEILSFENRNIRSATEE